jgi:hypothetical protein
MHFEGVQGKRREVHHQFFANPRAMAPADLIGHARALGVNTAVRPPASRWAVIPSGSSRRLGLYDARDRVPRPWRRERYQTEAVISLGNDGAPTLRERRPPFVIRSSIKC